jgi:alpha-L-rhamnosidase
VSWRRSERRLTLEVRVPVGATAQVHVPGAGEPETVGHGTHTWTVRDPVLAYPPLPTAPAIRDVLDNPAAWGAVVAAAVSTGVAADEADVAGRLTAYLDGPADDLTHALTPHAFPAAVVAALRGSITEAIAARNPSSSGTETGLT